MPAHDKLLHFFFSKTDVTREDTQLHFVSYLLLMSSMPVLCFSVQDKSMYDASHELQYLDMVIEETLRMYPPAPV